MSNKEFTDIVIASSATRLKLEGFRKSGILFARALPELTHFVGFQKSVSSSGNSIRITVNLAIWLPSLAANQASGLLTGESELVIYALSTQTPGGLSTALIPREEWVKKSPTQLLNGVFLP